MASLIDPVGPEGRGVYWRRRLVLCALVLLVVFGLAKACTGGNDSAATADGDPVASASDTTSPSPSKEPTASSTPTMSSAPVLPCKDSDVLVTARPSKENYAVGDTVNITYVVSTKGDVRCKRDVGGAADEVRVVSGSSIIWSSDYCSPGGKKDVRTIGPDDAFSVLVAWNGDVTSADCPDDKLPAPAGTYQVLGRNGAVFGPSATLTLG